MNSILKLILSIFILFGFYAESALGVTLNELRAAASQPMSFSMGKDWCQPPMTCQALIVAQGAVMPTTPKRFLDWLNLHPTPKGAMVSLNSVGGNFDASIELGLIIRKHGFNTYVGDGIHCQSACTYVFMGGMRREVAPSGDLMVHVNSYIPNSPFTPILHSLIQKASKNEVKPPRLTTLNVNPSAIHTPQQQDFHPYYESNDVTQAFKNAMIAVGIQIKYFHAMNIRPEMIDVVFHSFGPTMSVSRECMTYLQLDNTMTYSGDTGLVNQDPCGGARAIPIIFKGSEGGMSNQDIDTMLNP